MEEKETKRKHFPQNENVAPKKVKLLVTVVNRNKAEFYTDYLQEYEVNMQMSMNAKGTAGSDILHYLGLENSEKRVIFSLIREDMVKPALSGLEEKFETVRDGKGIAFTVPLTSVVGAAIYQFLTNNKQQRK